MDNKSVLLCLAIIAAIVFGAVNLQRKTNFYWKLVGKSKWKKLQSKIQNIRDIHDRMTGTGKKVSWIGKNLTKSPQKKLEKNKQAYYKYIDFCNDKHLDLPQIHDELVELIDETEESFLPLNEALDRELDRTRQRYDKTYADVCEAGEKFFAQRQDAVQVIDDIENFVNSISRYPKSFEIDIQEIKVQKGQFKDTVEFGIEQEKAIKASAKGAGAGVAAGTAVVSLAPVTAMWVATTFGTASTGTAISALSGAAATNAALAWLGGGALAAGGGGMAAGHAFLALAGPIGWGVAGTSVIVSVWLVWRKKHKIQESKREEIARMKKWIEALKEIKGKIDAISIKTSSLLENLKGALSACENMQGQDYTTFTDIQKKALGSIVNNTKAFAALLNMTIEDE